MLLLGNALSQLAMTSSIVRPPQRCAWVACAAIVTIAAAMSSLVRVIGTSGIQPRRDRAADDDSQLIIQVLPSTGHRPGGCQYEGNSESQVVPPDQTSVD